jgi:hypothetical protein
MLQAADDFSTQLRLIREVLWESLANFSIETVLGTSIPNGMDQSLSLSH